MLLSKIVALLAAVLLWAIAEDQNTRLRRHKFGVKMGACTNHPTGYHIYIYNTLGGPLPPCHTGRIGI